MTDNKPMMLYTATYDSVSAALTDLDAIEQLHKDETVGKYDAAVIDKENRTVSRTSSSRWTVRACASSRSGSGAAHCRARSSIRRRRSLGPAGRG